MIQLFQKLKRPVLMVVSLGVLLSPGLVSVSNVYADTPNLKGSLCQGTDKLQIDATKTCDTGQQATSQVNEIIGKVVNIFSVVVGIIAVIMIIVGGFKYITSGGESNNVSSAKNTILFAIVGLIIVGLAQLIVHFVLGHIAGVTGS